MQHEELIALIEGNRDLLPDGVSMNYAVIHTHYPDGTLIPTAERARTDASIKANLRREARLRGAKARETDIPSDGTDDSTNHVFFEFLNTDGVTLYAAVSVADVLSILSQNATQRRTAIRNAISNYLSELTARA